MQVFFLFFLKILEFHLNNIYIIVVIENNVIIKNNENIQKGIIT